MIRTKGPVALSVFFVSLPVCLDLLLSLVSEPWPRFFDTFFTPFFYLFLAFSNIVFLPLALVYLRRVEFQKDGCTVRWLMFRKFHAWDSLATKRFVRYPFDGRYKKYDFFKNAECVFFCTKQIPYGRFTGSPDAYLLLHRPLSLNCFYVELHPRKGSSQFPPPKDAAAIEGNESDCFFPVDREIFKQRMREWGVKIDGLDLDDEKTAQKKAPMGIFARAEKQPSIDETIQEEE